MDESEFVWDVFVVKQDPNPPCSRASEVGVEDNILCLFICLHDCKLINNHLGKVYYSQTLCLW
jgi:hypothetical protein